MELLKTPLNECHKAKGAKMVEFGGWEMPVQYEGIIKEHLHCRSQASLFDICHMGEFIVSGENSRKELSLILTHDFAKLPPSRCKYGFMLNEKGGVIDDLIVYCLKENEFMLVVNAARKDVDFNWLKKHLKESQIKDISQQTAKLDLQGPKSFEVLNQVFKQNFNDLKYFSFKEITFKNIKLLVSRTGYTGELGCELYLPWEKAQEVWELILEHPLVKPGGLGARDTLRLEVGLPLYGQDLDEEHTPVEAGYGFLITSQEDFIGKENLNQVKEKLIPLQVNSKRSPRHNDQVILGDKQVGVVTSGSFAPSLGYSIALAYIKKEFSEEENFIITDGKKKLEAKKTTLPFYKQGTARNKLS